MNTKARQKTPLDPEEVVFQYFKFLAEKNLSSLTELFAYDAIIYEPFSNAPDGLKGISSIEPFLRVAMMANSDLSRRIKIENKTENSIVALVTFAKGDSIRGRFTFGFEKLDGSNRIKLLRIQFL